MEFQFIPMTKVIRSAKPEDLPELPHENTGKELSFQKAQEKHEKAINNLQEARDHIEALKGYIDGFPSNSLADKLYDVEEEVDRECPDFENKELAYDDIKPLRSSVKDYRTAAIVDEKTANALKEGGHLVMEIDGGFFSKMRVWFTDLDEQEGAPKKAKEAFDGELSNQ